MSCSLTGPYACGSESPIPGAKVLSGLMDQGLVLCFDGAVVQSVPVRAPTSNFFEKLLFRPVAPLLDPGVRNTERLHEIGPPCRKASMNELHQIGRSGGGQDRLAFGETAAHLTFRILSVPSTAGHLMLAGIETRSPKSFSPAKGKPPSGRAK